MKVLHVIQGFGTGGAETWLYQVAQYIGERPELGVSLHFLATGGEKANYDDDVIKTGATMHYIKYSMDGWWKFRAAFVQLLEMEKFDVIHDHQDFISGWKYLLAIGHLPRVRISHLHNSYNFVANYTINKSRKISYHIGRKLTLLLSTKITGTSNQVMDDYGYKGLLYSGRRASPAYCGFDVEKFRFNSSLRADLCEELGLVQELRTGIFVGRIGLDKVDTAKNEKNPEFAFSLAKEILKKDPNWQFLFVGYKGNMGSLMENEAAEEGLGDKIVFLGQRKDVNRLMSMADVLIFPSHFEGLGMVVVEAQANGLPVLASDSIPQEAIVIPELVKRISLKDRTAWLGELLNVRRDIEKASHYNHLVEQSQFSIANSVANVLSLYRK